jgi:hypothetical protein
MTHAAQKGNFASGRDQEVPGKLPTLRMSLIAGKRRDEVNVRGISPN